MTKCFLSNVPFSPLRSAERGHHVLLRSLLRRVNHDDKTLLLSNALYTKESKHPLFEAAGNGFVKAVAILVEYGFNVTDIHQKDTSTPLYWAARKGHEGKFPFLLLFLAFSFFSHKQKP